MWSNHCLMAPVAVLCLGGALVFCGLYLPPACGTSTANNLRMSERRNQCCRLSDNAALPSWMCLIKVDMSRVVHTPEFCWLDTTPACSADKLRMSFHCRYSYEPSCHLGNFQVPLRLT
jgi:hypothetical protein